MARFDFTLFSILIILGIVVRYASANEGDIMICNTPSSTKCGIYASYTNEQVRQTVRYQTGGQTACAYEELRRQTNNAGFWVNFDIVGSNKGASIGYNPTGRSINLSQRTPAIATGQTHNDQVLLNGRCENEFGFGGVDVSISFENYYTNLPALY